MDFVWSKTKLNFQSSQHVVLQDANLSNFTKFTKAIADKYLLGLEKYMIRRGNFNFKYSSFLQICKLLA